MVPHADLNSGAPSGIRWFLTGIDRLGRLDGWVGALCLMALTCLMLAEVIARAASNFFGIGPGVVLQCLGVFLLSHGGGLHLRCRHDAAGRWAYPCHAASGELRACVPAGARGGVVGARLRRHDLPDGVHGDLHLELLRPRAGVHLVGHHRLAAHGAGHLRHGAARRSSFWRGPFAPLSTCRWKTPPCGRRTPSNSGPRVVLNLFSPSGAVHGRRSHCHVRHPFRPPGRGALDRSHARRDGHHPAGDLPRHSALPPGVPIFLEHPDDAGASGAAAVHPDG